MKPIIGITCSSERKPDGTRTGLIRLDWNYAEVVERAGGVPILLPPNAVPNEVLPLVHGLVIPGGDDIDPSLWGQRRHEKTSVIDPVRYESDKAYVRACPANLPILGICYGCQLLNVVAGGTLHQHVPDIVGHGEHSGGTMQEYHLRSDSVLRRAVKLDVAVGRSYHHQAIDRVGEGYQAVAHHEDGTIEAIESTQHPWRIGVQWHPERTLDNATTGNLLKALMAQAVAYAGG